MWFEYLIGCYSEREFATRGWLEAQENWLPLKFQAIIILLSAHTVSEAWTRRPAASLAARPRIRSWRWPSLQTLRTSVEFLSSFQLPFALLGLRSRSFLFPIFFRRPRRAPGPCRVPPGPQKYWWKLGKISGKLAARPLLPWQHTVSWHSSFQPRRLRDTGYAFK